MKTYGVNWFLVWVGLLVLFCPVSVWTEQVLLLPLWQLWHTTDHPPVLVLAVGLACSWTVLYYSIYGKILTNPKAVERARQSFQQSEAARHRRHRLAIRWATAFAVVGITSTICRLFFERPSWLHVAGYSLFLLFLPCSCLAATWLMDTAANKGQMARLLKINPEKAP